MSARNVTLKLDDAILKQCRHLAVQADQSLSQWISGLILKTVSQDAAYEQAREQSIQLMKRGFSLGKKQLTREELHERR